MLDVPVPLVQIIANYSLLSIILQTQDPRLLQIVALHILHIYQIILIVYYISR